MNFTLIVNVVVFILFLAFQGHNKQFTCRKPVDVNH